MSATEITLSISGNANAITATQHRRHQQANQQTVTKLHTHTHLRNCGTVTGSCGKPCLNAEIIIVMRLGVNS